MLHDGFNKLLTYLKGGWGRELCMYESKRGGIEAQTKESVLVAGVVSVRRHQLTKLTMFESAFASPASAPAEAAAPVPLSAAT